MKDEGKAEKGRRKEISTMGESYGVTKSIR